MYFTYILQSQKTDRYYTGHTNNIDTRLIQHNKGETKSTKSGIPWKQVWHTDFPTRSEAIQLELRIKKRGAKRFLQDLRVL
jgi:putative endonuclease